MRGMVLCIKLLTEFNCNNDAINKISPRAV
jgi:hypothetical protein